MRAQQVGEVIGIALGATRIILCIGLMVGCIVQIVKNNIPEATFLGVLVILLRGNGGD